MNRFEYVLQVIDRKRLERLEWHHRLKHQRFAAYMASVQPIIEREKQREARALEHAR